VIESRLFVIKDLGLQIEIQTLSGKVSKRFIDISRVRDIVINEVTFPPNLEVCDFLQCGTVFSNYSREREEAYSSISCKQLMLIFNQKFNDMKLKELVPIY